jgi:hypothetical protein
MISTPLPPGTLLLPNDYLIANNKPISGIIIDVVDDLWGKNYKIFLSNGNTVWKEEGSIADLWNVVK